MSTPVIRCEGVTKRFGATEALHGVDLVVEQGEVFGYLGPNGAGKTTTLRILMGLTRATTGRVELFGRPLRDRRVLAKVGAIVEAPALYTYLTGRDNLRMLADLSGGAAESRAQLAVALGLHGAPLRPVERRVGMEWTSRWSPDHETS